MALVTLIAYAYIYICIYLGNNGSPASHGGNDAGNAGNDAGMR